MRLTELEPRFLKILDDKNSQWEGITYDQADGIIFLCPKCFVANRGSVGTESVICWKPNVPQERDPHGGRWSFSGTGFDDLSLSPSILIVGGCGAHFFITNGGIT